MANEQVHPILRAALGTIIGESLDPAENRRLHLSALESAVEAARVRYYALDAELHEAQGDELGARWKRAIAARDWAGADACHRVWLALEAARKNTSAA